MTYFKDNTAAWISALLPTSFILSFYVAIYTKPEITLQIFSLSTGFTAAFLVFCVRAFFYSTEMKNENNTCFFD